MKCSFLLVLIVSVLLLSGLRSESVESPVPRPAQTKNDQTRGAQQQPAENQQGTTPATARIAPTVPPTQEHQTDRDAEQSKYEAQQYRSNRLLTWFNGSLAVFTLALVIVGWVQALHLRRTVQATKEAADAAMLSAKTTREAQRGYIFAGPISPIQNFVIGQEPLIWMGLKNVGPTRIYDCVSETWVEVLKKPFVDFSNNAHYQRKEDRFALYPNAPNAPGAPPGASYLVLMRWNEPLTEQQFRDIQADRWALCIRARFQYRDAFGEPVTQNCAFSSNSVIWETLPKYND